MRYQSYLNEFVRIISVVVFRNGRIIKTEYFGTLINETEHLITVKENDNKIIDVQKRFVKRVEKYEQT